MINAFRGIITPDFVKRFIERNSNNVICVVDRIGLTEDLVCNNRLYVNRSSNCTDFLGFMISYLESFENFSTNISHYIFISESISDLRLKLIRQKIKDIGTTKSFTFMIFDRGEIEVVELEE